MFYKVGSGSFFYASGPFVKVRVRLIDGCWSLLPSCSSLEIRSARLLFVVNPSIGHEIRDIDKWPRREEQRTPEIIINATTRKKNFTVSLCSYDFPYKMKFLIHQLEKSLFILTAEV